MPLVSKVASCPGCGREVDFWAELDQVFLAAAAVDLGRVRVFRPCSCAIDLRDLFATARLLIPELVVMD